jgi:hypothetical protein
MQTMSKGLRSRTCILHFAFCITLAAPASATVLLPADFSTAVTEASTIVHGRVSEVTSMLAGPRRTIESVVTVEVIESFKGSSAAGAALVFRVPNGQVGRYRRVVLGAPEFAAGDEVVVFLRGRPPAIPALYGLSQGVYRVSPDGNGRPVVTPVPVTAQGPGTLRVVRGDPARRPMPIDAFAREVRAVSEGRR